MKTILYILAIVLLMVCKINQSSEISVSFSNFTSDTITIRCSSLLFPIKEPGVHSLKEQEFLLAPNEVIDVFNNVDVGKVKNTPNKYEIYCKSFFNSITAFRNNDTTNVIDGCQDNIVEISTTKKNMADINLVFRDEDF